MLPTEWNTQTTTTTTTTLPVLSNPNPNPNPNPIFNPNFNPIFLASNRPIILNSIEASGLSITAPRIVHSGISTTAQLKFEGIGTADGNASFINAGQISAKDLFLNHLKSQQR